MVILRFKYIFDIIIKFEWNWLIPNDSLKYLTIIQKWLRLEKERKRINWLLWWFNSALLLFPNLFLTTDNTAKFSHGKNYHIMTLPTYYWHNGKSKQHSPCIIFLMFVNLVKIIQTNISYFGGVRFFMRHFLYISTVEFGNTRLGYHGNKHTIYFNSTQKEITSNVM